MCFSKNGPNLEVIQIRLFVSVWALIPYHSHLLLLLNHVAIVVKLCCVEGLMKDGCTSNKHSR